MPKDNKPASSPALQKLDNELRLLNYSPRTRRAYCGCFADYYAKAKIEAFDSIPNIPLIKEFLTKKFADGLAPQTINLYLNAIKFYYRRVCGFKGTIAIKFAKRRSNLPEILSREEIFLALKNIKNRVHYILIALAYGSGLRVSELVGLSKTNLNFTQGLIHVVAGKGNRDRLVIMPQELSEKLSWLQSYYPLSPYLFTSTRGGHISARCAQLIFQKALFNAGIKRKVGFHSLRHSFATHLLEDGVDIRYIQELMGHRDIRTTQIYTKVTKSALRSINSPLARLPASA